MTLQQGQDQKYKFRHGSLAGNVYVRHFRSLSVFQGPAVRAWYNALDKIIGPLAKRAALKKMAADQLFFAPSFLTIFVSYMALTQGGGKQEIIQKLKKEYLQILTTNYKVNH